MQVYAHDCSDARLMLASKNGSGGTAGSTPPLLHRQAQGPGTSAHQVYTHRQPGRQHQRGRTGGISRSRRYRAAQRVEHRDHRAGQRARERGRAAVPVPGKGRALTARGPGFRPGTNSASA